MPECLQPILQGQSESLGQVLFVPTPDAAVRVDNPPPTASSLDPDVDRAVLHALAAAYPRSVDRARVLFEWLGSSGSPWSGYPCYEEVPEHHLMRIPLESLVQALQTEPIREKQLAGAARFYAGFQFATRRWRELPQLPVSLRARLLGEGLRTADQDRRARAQFAFGKPG
jgi:hypothetical protein